MRVILDANVLISALSPSGTPARIVVAWQEGHFDLIVSPLLLAELRRALTYPKLRRRITAGEADEFVDWLARSAVVATDPGGAPPMHSDDAGDDYLLALAAAEDAVLVSGDEHLLVLASDLPIRAPADFFAFLDVRA